MEYLLLNDNEITQNTVLGGNIDVDKYKFCIQDAQLSKLIEILGEDLYEKIKTDFENDALSGDYETLYTKYINPFLIHQSALEYLLIGAYTVGNAGIYQVTPQNGTPVGRDEIDYLVKNQRNKAEIYQGRLERYLCKVHFDEYKIDSDNIVNPKKQGYGGISFL